MRRDYVQRAGQYLNIYQLRVMHDSFPQTLINNDTFNEFRSAVLNMVDTMGCGGGNLLLLEGYCIVLLTNMLSVEEGPDRTLRRAIGSVREAVHVLLMPGIVGQ